MSNNKAITTHSISKQNKDETEMIQQSCLGGKKRKVIYFILSAVFMVRILLGSSI